MAVPTLRLVPLNDVPADPHGRFVLYWMTACRRATFNPALDHAINLAVANRRPLLVIEALGTRYRWACDRFHRFVLDGMTDNQRAFASTPATYACWLGRGERDEGAADFASVAQQAVAVVLDDAPAGFQRPLNRALAARCTMQVVAVDGNGVMPLRAATELKQRAVDYRRVVQRSIAPHLLQMPAEKPFAGVSLPALDWLPTFAADPATCDLAALPIDHTVGPVALRGGTTAARAHLSTFMASRYARYDRGRNDVEDSAASGLSPWLHFGHLSTHEVCSAVFSKEHWSIDHIIERKVTGSKEGWWGMSAPGEALLDQLLVWRELGFHFCHHVPDHTSYEGLPAWARTTLGCHAADPRPHRYDLAELAAAQTHDAVWNAAQTQLVREGVMHNYLRMLWAKKVLEWSASPAAALAVLIELNNRYALDGRDPNSYTGIMWTLGRFDRPWAPERAIFGSIRYMSSDSARRKLDLDDYLARYAAAPQTSFL